MSSRSRQQNKEYADLLKEEDLNVANKINEKGQDINQETLRWLARAFALIALIIGLCYIVLFFKQIL